MKITDIITPSWNTRSAINDGDVRALAESIKADGLIQPINVYKAGAQYVCFDGNRRLAACRSLGLDEIAATIWDITEEEAMIKSVTANLQREDDDPLLAAALVAKMGGDAEIIASKLGKTVSWVRRRAKLNALSDDLRALAGNVTLDVLERLSDLSAKDQGAIAKQIADRVKWANGAMVKWNEVKRDVDKLTADLELAKFDTAGCLGCSSRTGADWFAEDTVKLGRCLDCKCYKSREKAWEDGEIAKVIPADAEKVRLDYEYQMDYAARQDMSDRRDKKHPCAYYWFYADDGLIVKWAKSKKQIEEDKIAESNANAEAAEAKRAERDRENAIETKLTDYITSDECEVAINLMIRKLITKGADECMIKFIADSVYEYMGGYNADATEIVTAFPEVAAAAGITADDVSWYLERFAKSED